MCEKEFHLFSFNLNMQAKLLNINDNAKTLLTNRAYSAALKGF